MRELGCRFVKGQPEWWLWNMYVYHRRWFHAALVANAEICIAALANGRYDDDMLWDFSFLPEDSLGKIDGVSWSGVRYVCESYQESVSENGSNDTEELVLTSAYINALIVEDHTCKRYADFIRQLTDTSILGV